MKDLPSNHPLCLWIIRAGGWAFSECYPATSPRPKILFRFTITIEWRTRRLMYTEASRPQICSWLPLTLSVTPSSAFILHCKLIGLQGPLSSARCVICATHILLLHGMALTALPNKWPLCAVCVETSYIWELPAMMPPMHFFFYLNLQRMIHILTTKFYRGFKSS